MAELADAVDSKSTSREGVGVRLPLWAPLGNDSIFVRAVAQPGSALAWGARGREFESLRPDHFFIQNPSLRK